jgi:GT2 family glycosyltransferase
MPGALACFPFSVQAGKSRVPKPRVSIIVPTYNRADMLLRTLSSIIGQTYTDWEALVVDDGSTDHTAELLQDSHVDRRIVYIRQPNGGVSAARNTGIRAATGQYIAFLDSDDLWKPWKLELQTAALEENADIGMVWTDMEAIDGQDAIVRSNYLREFYSSYKWFTNETLFSSHRAIARRIDGLEGRVVHVGNIFSAMLTGNLVHTSTVMLRRARLQQTGFFDEAIRPSGEDYDFHLRTCRAGAVGFLDVVTTSYRIGNADQLTKPENATYLAEQFLRTVTAALQRDEAAVAPDLRPLIKEALYEGHEWAAEEHLKAGNASAARKHLMRAVSCSPRHVRAFGLLAASLLPSVASDRLRGMYRLVKGYFIT